MANAIEVDAVSKRYLIGARPSNNVREALVNALPWRGQEGASREVWSLRDVSFEVPSGGVVGVVGRNGAGKSTLLKVLSRITEPTRGVSRTRGRTASLLEVGTGFHSELTGRENVYLNGAVLGMSRREIAARFQDIVDFAGVGRYIDTPIKRYSSGMNLRLAFAVAAHVEPEILIVDEVLAVGDVEFQRKCLSGMEKVGAEGRTVVMVSHDLDAVARLCPRSLWLDRGQLRMDGPTADVIDAYLLATQLDAPESLDLHDARDRIVVHSVRVTDGHGRPASSIRRTPFHIEVDLTVNELCPGLDLAIYVTNQRGARVFDEVWSDTVEQRPPGPGRFVVSLGVPPVLNVGTYTVGLWAGRGQENFLDVDATTVFTIDGSTKGRPDRVVDLMLPWSCRTVGDPRPIERAARSG
jgi:ABC-2 type transport system ATP-binding protein/lipopolysaccharide transport system ATP-binding protein